MYSKYAKENPNSGSFSAFAGKVFMIVDGSLHNQEECRFKLETMFEEHFKPDKDFVDHIEIKKQRRFE